MELAYNLRNRATMMQHTPSKATIQLPPNHGTLTITPPSRTLFNITADVSAISEITASTTQPTVTPSTSQNTFPQIQPQSYFPNGINTAPFNPMPNTVTFMNAEEIPKFRGRRLPQDEIFVVGPTFSEFTSNLAAYFQRHHIIEDSQKINLLRLLVHPSQGDARYVLSHFLDPLLNPQGFSYEELIDFLKRSYTKTEELIFFRATQHLMATINDKVAPRDFKKIRDIETSILQLLETYKRRGGFNESTKSAEEHCRDVLLHMALAAWGGEKLTTEVLEKLSIDENATILGLKTNEFINKEEIKKNTEVCCISALPITGRLAGSSSIKKDTPGGFHGPIGTGRPQQSTKWGQNPNTERPQQSTKWGQNPNTERPHQATRWGHAPHSGSAGHRSSAPPRTRGVGGEIPPKPVELLNNIFCFKCGYSNHVSTHCNKRNLFCTFCKSPTHNTVVCRKKFREGRNNYKH